MSRAAVPNLNQHVRLDNRTFGIGRRASASRHASKRIHKPRRGLNDISVLSKSCYSSNLSRNNAAIWRISVNLQHFDRAGRRRLRRRSRQRRRWVSKIGMDKVVGIDLGTKRCVRGTATNPPRTAKLLPKVDSVWLARRLSAAIS